MQERKIPIGISACLMGQEVRYNGGHKRSVFCLRNLAPYVDYRTFCPEVAIGMGVPRPAVRLQVDFDAPRVVASDGGALDVTDDLARYSHEAALSMGDLSGFIFMKNSPSCGLYSTKVYTEKGIHQKKRGGIFASAVTEAHPNLPVEEEGRLNDPVLRESFIARVFIYDQIRQMSEQGIKPSVMVSFHSKLKYLVMSYGQPLYTQLGRIVARAGVGDVGDVWQEYISTLMQGTQKAPNRRGHSNALYHLLGYLKKDLSGDIRQELAESIEEYRRDLVPLAVPMKLLGHYISHSSSEYIREQVYLSPYPRELGLRNAL